MTFQPPPGQGPIDPNSGQSAPPPPGGSFPPPPGAFMPPAAGMSPQPSLRPGSLPPPPQFQFQSPPPGGPMRPPMFYPPPPPPRRGGVGRAIVIALLLLLLGGSVLLNIVLIAAHADNTGRQETLVSGDGKNTIAVVPLEGLINEKEAAKFERLMDRVENDSSVKGVVVRVDTPGGAVTASDEIYQRIERFKSRKQGIPVVISMGSMATSGGYYASCAGDHLFAERTSLTGNIGVLLPMYNISELAQKYGIQDATIVSTGAIYKNAGSMFKPQNAKDQAYLQSIADNAFTSFKSVVTGGRKNLLKKPIDEIADGRVYTAERAVAEGLVDKIGYLEDAWLDAASSAGLSNPQVLKFDEHPTFLDLLSSESAFTHGGAHATTVNGVNIQLDETTLSNLLTPRLMYLWRP